MNEKAEDYNKQGMFFLRRGQFNEAVDFFSKAIEIDPHFSEAYRNRGEIFLKTNRISEGNSDIRKAKDLSSVKCTGESREKSTTKKKDKTVKLNWDEVDSIFDSVFQTDSQDFENNINEHNDCFYDNILLGDSVQTDEAWEEVVKPIHETQNYPAIIEFVNGNRVEVARVRLFEPTCNDISIVRQDGHVKRVVPFEDIACIRKAGMPANLIKNKDSVCHVENIETVGGKIYQEAIHPEQDIDNVLFGFPTKENNIYIYTLIPTVNIRKRYQDRCLGKILLEKQLISSDILEHALDEYQQNKTMKLGKIIAQKTKINYPEIEDVLKQAKAHEGLKTGELLLSSELVNEEQVNEALEHQEYLQNMKIGHFLVEKGIVQENDIYLALAEKYRIPLIDLRKQKISRKILAVFSKSFVLQNEILPIALDNDILTVATVKPEASDLLYEEIIKERKCKDVQFVLALPTQLRIVLDLLDKKNGFSY